MMDIVRITNSDYSVILGRDANDEWMTETRRTNRGFPKVSVQSNQRSHSYFGGRLDSTSDDIDTVGNGATETSNFAIDWRNTYVTINTHPSRLTDRSLHNSGTQVFRYDNFGFDSNFGTQFATYNLVTAKAHLAPAQAIHEDIARRLDRFKHLEDGWADGMQHAGDWGSGYGKAPHHEELDWLKQQFATHYPSTLDRPYLYPTPEGGVEAEWSIGSNAASLEIDLETHEAEWHNLNFDTDDSYERWLNLDEPDGWEWLVSELRVLGIQEA